MVVKILGWFFFIVTLFLAIKAASFSWFLAIVLGVFCIPVFPLMDKHMKYDLSEKNLIGHKFLAVVTGMILFAFFHGRNEHRTDQPLPPKQRLVWNIDAETDFSAEEKKMLGNASIQILEGKPECLSIEFGDRSRIEKGAYYVRCTAAGPDGNGFDVTFTKADVAEKTILVEPEIYPDADLICEEALKRKLRYPETFERKFFGYDRFVTRAGTAHITRHFTAKNSYGVPDKFTGKCTVGRKGEIEASLKNTSKTGE